MTLNINDAKNVTQATSLAGLTGLSGAATTYSTAALTLQYAIKGLAYAKAQVSGGATPTTDIVTGAAFVPLLASQVCVFVFCFDAAGSVLRVAQGKVFSWLDTSARSVATPFPVLPDTLCPFAYAVVKNGTTGSSWVFGTGNWNATGIVIDTPVNVQMLPSAPPETA